MLWAISNPLFYFIYQNLSNVIWYGAFQLFVFFFPSNLFNQFPNSFLKPLLTIFFNKRKLIPIFTPSDVRKCFPNQRLESILRPPLIFWLFSCCTQSQLSQYNENGHSGEKQQGNSCKVSLFLVNSLACPLLSDVLNDSFIPLYSPGPFCSSNSFKRCN